MTDRELLELAAKAAGIEYHNYGMEWFDAHWNPLADDGDALRLAVKLQLTTLLRPRRVEIMSWPELTGSMVFGFDNGLSPRVESVEPYGDDPYAATRRAIVRAAAEIGERRE